jgi:virulence-associated protein VapD
MQPAYNQPATYEICFGNSFHIKKNNLLDNRGYNIKSSGFGIEKVEGTVYLSDVPINENQGTIFYFTLKDNVPFIVKNNAGVVYYKKGEVYLDTVNIISSVSPNGVEIQAVPESNDVIALQDIYLELSIDNLIVNMVEDRISSGENTSATEYIVTSSYSNGAYTR